MPAGCIDGFLTSASFSPFVVSFTFYSADPEDHEQMPPTGSEDNPINSVYLDPSDTQFSRMEPDEELGTLTVSGVTHDGFDLSWNLTAHSIYDSFTVEYTDIRQLRDKREIPLPGDVSGASIRGLKALTEYQIKLYGEIRNQRSALLEAVAVTGIRVFFVLELGMHNAHFCPLNHSNVIFSQHSNSNRTRSAQRKLFSSHYLLHFRSISAVTDDALVILCIPKQHFMPFVFELLIASLPPQWKAVLLHCRGRGHPFACR